MILKISAFLKNFNLLRKWTTLSVLTIATLPQCSEVEGKGRLAGDLRIEEGSEEHSIVFTIAGATLVIFVIGFPLGVSTVLLQKWRQINFLELRHRFESWTGAFTVKGMGFLWPTIVILRKVVLLLVSRLVTEPLQQYVLVSLVLTISYIFVSWLGPYRFRMVTNLEEFKLILALLTIGLGAILFAVSTLSDQPTFEGVELFLGVLVIIIQVFGILFTVSAALIVVPNVLREVYNLVMPKVVSVLNKICSRERCRRLCGTRDKGEKIIPHQSRPNVESDTTTEVASGALPATYESHLADVPTGTNTDAVLADEDSGVTLETETKKDSIRIGEVYHPGRGSDTGAGGLIDGGGVDGMGYISRSGVSDVDISEGAAETNFTERLEELEMSGAGDSDATRELYSGMGYTGRVSDTDIAEDAAETKFTERLEELEMPGFGDSADTGVADLTSELYGGISYTGRPRSVSDLGISEDAAESIFNERLEELEP